MEYTDNMTTERELLTKRIDVAGTKSVRMYKGVQERYCTEQEFIATKVGDTTYVLTEVGMIDETANTKDMVGALGHLRVDKGQHRAARKAQTATEKTADFDRTGRISRPNRFLLLSGMTTPACVRNSANDRYHT